MGVQSLQNWEIKCGSLAIHDITFFLKFDGAYLLCALSELEPILELTLEIFHVLSLVCSNFKSN